VGAAPHRTFCRAKVLVDASVKSLRCKCSRFVRFTFTPVNGVPTKYTAPTDETVSLNFLHRKHDPWVHWPAEGPMQNGIYLSARHHVESLTRQRNSIASIPWNKSLTGLQHRLLPYVISYSQNTPAQNTPHSQRKTPRAKHPVRYCKQFTCCLLISPSQHGSFEDQNVLGVGLCRHCGDRGSVTAGPDLSRCT